MEFSLKRSTYDWILVLTDNTGAVAHGQQGWTKTQQCITQGVADYARVQRDYRAKLTDGCWEISHKSGVVLGWVRPMQDPSVYSVSGYKYEYATTQGVWSPVWDLRAAANGWHLNYVAQMAA